MIDKLNINPKNFDGPILVTGAGGCIGAWVIALCLKSDIPVIAFDLKKNTQRLKLLINDEESRKIKWIEGDISNSNILKTIIKKNDIRSIIHLAALQVPFCASDPIKGAKTNVVGTVNILEAVRENNLKRLVYASSVAAHGVANKKNYLATLYGAYKLCNENTANIFYQDWKVPSIGIRPGIVYGLGRDQGMTSKTTLATLAAAAKIDYTIPFSGPISALHAKEAAAAFIKAVSENRDQANIFDLNGILTTVEKWIKILNDIEPNSKITTRGTSIPFPFHFSDDPLKKYIGDYETIDLEYGIKSTFDCFKDLLKKGKISAKNIN